MSLGDNLVDIRSQPLYLLLGMPYINYEGPITNFVCLSEDDFTHAVMISSNCFFNLKP